MESGHKDPYSHFALFIYCQDYKDYVDTKDMQKALTEAQKFFKERLLYACEKVLMNPKSEREIT